MKFYLESVENTLKKFLQTHTVFQHRRPKQDCKSTAKQTCRREESYPAAALLEQLSDPMLIILMVAAVVSGITNYLSGESPVDVFIIMFVVILNSVLGVIQESKAEKAIEALKEMSAATSKVYRDGNLVTVKVKTSFPATLSRWKQATLFLPIRALSNVQA